MDVNQEGPLSLVNLTMDDMGTSLFALKEAADRDMLGAGVPCFLNISVATFSLATLVIMMRARVQASRGPSPPPSASASQKPPSPRLPHLSHNLPTSSARSPAHSSPGLVSGNRSTVTTEVGGVAGHRRKGTLDGRWPKDNTAQPYPHQLRPPLQSPGQRLNAELRQQPQSPLELSYQQASQPPQMSVEQSYGLASEPPQSYQQASQRPWASAEHSYGQPPHSSLEQSYQQASQSPLTSVERSYGQASQPPQTSIEQNYGLASPPPQSSLEQSYQQASQPPRTSAEQSYAQALQPPLGSSEQSPWKASVQPWTSVEHGYQQAPSPPPGSLEPSHPSSSQQPVGSERQGIRPLEHLRKLLHTAADPHAVHKGANGVSSGQAEGLLHPAAVPHAVHNRVHGVGSSQAEGPPQSTATPQLHGSTGETSPLDSSWNSNGSRPPLTSAARSNGARWLPQDALPHQNPPSAQDLGPPSLADRIGSAQGLGGPQRSLQALSGAQGRQQQRSLRLQRSLQALSGAQGRQQQQPPVSGAVSDADCNPALRLEAGPGACGLQQQPPVSAAVSHADYSEALRLQAGSGVSGLQQQQQQQSSQPNGPGSLLMSILAQRRGEPQAAQMAYLAPSQSPQLLGRYQNAPSQSPQLLGSYQTAPSQSPQLLGSYQTAPSQSPQLLSSYQTAPSQSPQLLGSYQTAPSQSPQLQRTLQGYPGLYHTTMAGHPQASYMMHSGSPPVYALQQGLIKFKVAKSVASDDNTKDSAEKTAEVYEKAQLFSDDHFKNLEVPEKVSNAFQEGLIKFEEANSAASDDDTMGSAEQTAEVYEKAQLFSDDHFKNLEYPRGYPCSPR
eukprot:gene27439-4740_t